MDITVEGTSTAKDTVFAETEKVLNKETVFAEAEIVVTEEVTVATEQGTSDTHPPLIEVAEEEVSDVDPFWAGHRKYSHRGIQN